MTILNTLVSKPAGPRTDRVRHELKRRTVTVRSTALLTPGMLRITFAGEDLADFDSPGFDDYVKLLVPGAPGEVERRDYTPRRFDPAARTLAIDFAVHDAGPATQWALAAQPGDTLQIGGPKGSRVIAAEDVGRWLLIGDETALPAIGRQIEAAEAGVPMTSLVAVAGPQEQQSFATAAWLTSHWVHRPLSAANDPGALLAAVRGLDVTDDTFVWVAAEAGVARAIRNHLVEERGHPAAWMKAAGYWLMGRSDAHERID